MRYQQPAGKASGEPYLDGNRNAGIRGDVPPAAAIEHPQRELAHLIAYSGQTPAADDLEQVRKAVEAIIDMKTGEGPEEDYLTLAVAAARLPIFPEVLTANGRINVISPGAGSILVPPTVSLLRRGIALHNTSDYDEPARTFATSANRTYHLRWRPAADELALEDLADGGYNPGALAETSSVFDSTYDDVLIARAVTNGANVVSVTNLSNKADLVDTVNASATNVQNGGQNFARGEIAAPLDWARTPRMKSMSVIRLSGGGGAFNDFDRSIFASMVHPSVGTALGELPATRYGFFFTLMNDFANSFRLALGARA